MFCCLLPVQLWVVANDAFRQNVLNNHRLWFEKNTFFFVLFFNDIIRLHFHLNRES